MPVQPAHTSLKCWFAFIPGRWLGMTKCLLTLLLSILLSGCVVGTVAEAAVDVATIPVKVVSAGVDAATTSRSEADEKRGRELRKAEEARGRDARKAEERCRKGRPLPEDVCPQP
jgi:hypothetical protein